MENDPYSSILMRTKSGQDESDLHPAMRSLQDWYLQQHPEDQHGIDPLMDRMNSALHGLDRPLSRTTPPAERPTQDSNEAWGRFVGKGDATMLYHRMSNLECQRNEAREQRDRLADALRTWQRIAYAGANHEGLANARHQTDAALAAVKGGTNANVEARDQ